MRQRGVTLLRNCGGPTRRGAVGRSVDPPPVTPPQTSEVRIDGIVFPDGILLLRESQYMYGTGLIRLLVFHVLERQRLGNRIWVGVVGDEYAFDGRLVGERVVAIPSELVPRLDLPAAA